MHSKTFLSKFSQVINATLYGKTNSIQGTTTTSIIRQDLKKKGKWSWFRLPLFVWQSPIKKGGKMSGKYIN